ncbi:MAG: type II toxin-antitoxin system HipA family toxin YjjJ, partial [Aeromonas sp.]
MSIRSEKIRLYLRQGPLTSSELADLLGVSQPTISRELRSLGADIVRFSAEKSIRYALRNPYSEFNSVPIYRVTEAGQVEDVGELIPVRPGGFVMVQNDSKSLHSDGLPWWLCDMRPQGYLGRAYAAAYAAELNLPANSAQWSDADVVKALLAHGHDAVGNLLIGERARERFLSMPEPTVIDRATEFPVLAQAAGTGEAPGSSAGGEQPKFCTYTDHGHVLVKFSVPDDNLITQRWRDLLLAEHLALDVLGVETKIFDFGGQRFLEIPRFDRVGTLGRIGVFSLLIIDMEFVGSPSNHWPIVVNQLIKDGHVHPDAAARTSLLWAFGQLIGNTDMHKGNLSFISGRGRPYHLAPAYDILPMAFSPARSGAVGNELEPLLPAVWGVVSADTWREALRLAK